MTNLEGRAMSKERSSTGRSFHADRPTTEKALSCTVAKWAQGTKSSPTQQNAALNSLPKPTLGSRGQKGKTGRSILVYISFDKLNTPNPKKCSLLQEMADVTRYQKEHQAWHIV